MPEELKALIGVAALGLPFLLALVMVAIAERRDGKTRFVIVGGRCRRRSLAERKR